MPLNMLLNLRIVVLLVAGRTEHLEIVLMIRLTTPLIEWHSRLGYLVDLTCHHWSKRQELALVFWCPLILNQVPCMVVVVCW